MNEMCDAHMGMAENIRYLRDGQAQLFDLSRETSKDIKEISVEQAKQGAKTDIRLDAQDAKLDEILRAVGKPRKKIGPAKLIAIIVPSLIGGGGLFGGIAAVIEAWKTKGGVP